MPFQPEIGVAFDARTHAENGTNPRAYFSSVLEKTASYLAASGLNATFEAAAMSSVPRCQSLSEWKTIFHSRIADPISNSVHLTRALFDFQPLCGDRNLAVELKQTVTLQLTESGPFIPVMANDTLSNLPPLTFFHGLVVELDGAQRETLDVESTALGLITDAARVFALAAGNLEVTNTLARLEQAAITMPLHATVLQEAARRFASPHISHAIAGFSGDNGSALIRPSLLGRYDQRLLKSAFETARLTAP